MQIQQVQEEANALKEFTERKTIHRKNNYRARQNDGGVAGKIKCSYYHYRTGRYLPPYKPKRRTKAQIAREAGLEPLSRLVLEQKNVDLEKEAAAFINDTIKTTDEALQGARDIIAETINEDAEVRARLRKLFEDTANVESKVVPEKEAEAIKYKDYFNFSEPVHKIPSHRILAVLRGFLEGLFTYWYCS